MRDARLTDQAVTEKAADVGEEICRTNFLRETDGNNRSPQIDRIQRLYETKGVSYCAETFFYFRFKACAYVLGLPNVDLACLGRMKRLHEQTFGPCSTSCAQIVEDYTQRGLWLEVRPEGKRKGTAQTIAAFRAQIRRGDAVLFDWGGGEHHIEMFLRWENGKMVTAGANTKQDGGGGVEGGYIKHRPLDTNVWGCVRFNR